MNGIMDSLAFLDSPGKHKLQPVYALHGDETFLQRRALAALRGVVLGENNDGMGLSTHEGDTATWATVHDELQTLPFLSARRLVVVENGDPFVSRERARLEKYVTAHPPGSTVPAGVLVLMVSTLPGNTRLAKLLGEQGAIACKAPKADELVKWCTAWARTEHGKSLPAQAARLLADLVGPEMGLLAQELAKLAAFAGDSTRIEAADVDRLVGSSREEDAFRIFELIGSGQTGPALEMLNRQLDRGEEPLRLLAAYGWRLRRLAQAGRLSAQGVPLGDALEQVGLAAYPTARRQAEQQMRHLGRRRLDSLYDWLLQTDFGIKGASALSARTLLERLVIQLSRPRQP